MRGEGLSTSREIVVTDDEPILAVDVFRRWGAAFRFSVSHSGHWYAGAILTVQRPDGTWEDNGGGGVRGSEWTVPWRPPDRGWDGEMVLALGTTSQAAFDDDHEYESIAVVGFVAPPIRALDLEYGPHRRQLAVTSPVGAFVALGVADGRLRMQPQGAAGEPIGPSRQF